MAEATLEVSRGGGTVPDLRKPACTFASPPFHFLVFHLHLPPRRRRRPSRAPQSIANKAAVTGFCSRARADPPSLKMTSLLYDTPTFTPTHAPHAPLESGAPTASAEEDPADAALALMSFFSAPRVESPSVASPSADENHAPHNDEAVTSTQMPAKLNPVPTRTLSTMSTDTTSTVDMNEVAKYATPAEIARLAATGLSSNGPTGRRQSKREHPRKPSRLQDDADSDEDNDDKAPRRHWSGVARGPAPPAAGVSEVERESERRLRMNHLRRCNEDMRILMLGWSSIEVREPGKVPHFV